MIRIHAVFRPALASFVLLLLTAISAPASAAEPALDLSQYKGKVVVVDFWASWCVPCRRSFPWLNEMRAKYADQGLVIVGVNVDAERADADKFLADVPASFAIVYDPKGQLATEYQVSAMPTSLVFDRAGAPVTRHLGFQNAKRDEYEETLRKTLATTATAARP